MSRSHMNSTFGCCSRRHFLASNALGVGSLALAWLLNDEKLLAGPTMPPLGPRKFDLHAKTPPREPRARAMISLFMGGGPSHIDLLDPKPLMRKYDGSVFPGKDIKFDNAGGASMTVMASQFQFQPHGQSGMEISEVMPRLAEIVDDITLIRSMNLGGIRNHVAGMRALNTGDGRGSGKPALGSWLTYGLGSESKELPAFVAMTVGSYLPGSPYWSSGYLPSLYQGTVVREKEPRIQNLDPPARLKGEAQEDSLGLLERLNRLHSEQHPGELDLEARIASFELAARMQGRAKEILNLNAESLAIRKLYGLDDPVTRPLGEACLIARRLIEHGVRFVQIWNYAWDMHDDIFGALSRRCRAIDQPCAALVKDLKQRGLLDTTLVHWGGEMGRLPVVQNRGPSRKPGRDHNTDGFSLWLAGGGVKGGCVYGKTDDFGHQAVENIVSHHDYHATLLHLFGLDPQRLVYHRNGQELALVEGSSGKAIRDILR